MTLCLCLLILIIGIIQINSTHNSLLITMLFRDCNVRSSSYLYTCSFDVSQIQCYVQELCEQIIKSGFSNTKKNIATLKH